MFVKTLVSLLPVVARVANAVPFNQLEERADYCAVGEGGAPTSIVKVITSEEVHYPVLIDTYCPENTILTGDGGKLHNDNCASLANKICQAQLLKSTMLQHISGLL